MNDKIRELAVQSGMVRILDEHAHEYGNGVFDNTLYPELEKFARLIIEECAQRAEAYAYMSANFSALAEELRRMTGDEESEEDSTCPLCGFDGGTQCGMPNCQY